MTEQPPPRRVIRADFHPVVHADFQNTDAEERVRLNTAAALSDIATLGIELQPGMRVLLDGGELMAIGEVLWSDSEETWVAEVVEASSP